MTDWTTIAVAAVGGVTTLVAGSQDVLFGHRLHRRRKIEDLRFERDAKERDAIYELFERLPELEAAVWNYVASERSDQAARERLSVAFTGIRPYQALLRDDDARNAVAKAMNVANEIGTQGEAKSASIVVAVEEAQAANPEFSPVSVWMHRAMDELSERLDALYA